MDAHEHRTVRANQTAEETEHISFEILDSHRRIVGALVWTREADFIDAPAGVNCWYTLAPGHYYIFQPQASRDGKRYGASQRTQYFLNAETRAKAIEKYLATAKKRASK